MVRLCTPLARHLDSHMEKNKSHIGLEELCFVYTHANDGQSWKLSWSRNIVSISRKGLGQDFCGFMRGGGGSSLAGFLVLRCLFISSFCFSTETLLLKVARWRFCFLWISSSIADTTFPSPVVFSAHQINVRLLRFKSFWLSQDTLKFYFISLSLVYICSTWMITFIMRVCTCT